LLQIDAQSDTSNSDIIWEVTDSSSLTNDDLYKYVSTTVDEYAMLKTTLKVTWEGRISDNLQRALQRYKEWSAIGYIIYQDLPNSLIGHFTSIFLYQVQGTISYSFNFLGIVHAALFDSLWPAGRIVLDSVRRYLESKNILVDYITHIDQGATLHCGFYSIYFLHRAAVAYSQQQPIVREFNLANSFSICQQVYELIPKIYSITRNNLTTERIDWKQIFDASTNDSLQNVANMLKQDLLHTNMKPIDSINIDGQQADVNDKIDTSPSYKKDNSPNTILNDDNTFSNANEHLNTPGKEVKVHKFRLDTIHGAEVYPTFISKQQIENLAKPIYQRYQQRLEERKRTLQNTLKKKSTPTREKKVVIGKRMDRDVILEIEQFRKCRRLDVTLSNEQPPFTKINKEPAQILDPLTENQIKKASHHSLQKTCSHYGLGGQGTKETLKNRLREYMNTQASVDTPQDTQQNKETTYTFINEDLSHIQPRRHTRILKAPKISQMFDDEPDNYTVSPNVLPPLSSLFSRPSNSPSDSIFDEPFTYK
jgi:hypothetical protein